MGQHRGHVHARLALCALAAAVASSLSACDGCTGPVSAVDDAGSEGEGDFGEGEGDVGEGEGEGEVSVDGGVADAGPTDAGVDTRDAGNGFDLGSLLDGGIDGLQCLPTSLPQLSVSGALDALGLNLYTGHSETGVVCGIDPRVTCDEGVPCCVLCGAAGCAAPTDGGRVSACPPFTQTYSCDGNEDCSGSDICCFTLSGTECRPESDCNFDVGGTLQQFLGDGGIRLPDAGVVDGGFFDGGFVSTPVDGGDPTVDGGFVDDPVPGPPGPVPDAGSLVDGLQTTLDQGVPVCTSTLRDCDLLGGQACCSSDRLPAVDVGFCLPALLCLGNLLP